MWNKCEKTCKNVQNSFKTLSKSQENILECEKSGKKLLKVCKTALNLWENVTKTVLNAKIRGKNF